MATFHFLTQRLQNNYAFDIESMGIANYRFNQQVSLSYRLSSRLIDNQIEVLFFPAVQLIQMLLKFLEDREKPH